MATKKRPPTKSGKPRKRKGVKLEPTTLAAPDLPFAAELPAEVQQLADAVRQDGGAVIGAYKEPLGGHALMFVALPVDKVEPTPFQRDVSDAHVRKLVRAMDKTKRYLDPIVVVRKDGKYLCPNGGHRLSAVTELGAKSIPALLVPEVAVAYQILALNIEKAHNLREKSLEVVRMYKDLAAFSDATEEEMQLEMEEPGLITLGFAYEQRGRLAGGQYLSILRKVDGWLPSRIRDGIPQRQRRSQLVIELDDAVSGAVERLKARGFNSPYLKAFVVARINPLRFMKDKVPPMAALFAEMTRRAQRLDAGKINQQDVARTGGAPETADE